MLIDDYFQAIRNTIEASRAVHSSSVTYDKRTSYVGFIRGTILLLDGSTLYFRKFVDVETAVERYMYAYQYQRGEELVFRYDNTEHHRKLKLSTFSDPAKVYRAMFCSWRAGSVSISVACDSETNAPEAG